MIRMSRRELAYEVVMASLAITTIALALRPSTPTIERAIVAIWVVFVADYVVRLWAANDKRRFFRENLSDLIAILPVGLLRAARLLRLVRLLRVVRGMAVLWRVSGAVRGVLRTNQLGYVLLFTLALVIAGGIVIHEVEPEIGTLQDGLWWSLVTATTVGYGDLAPKTTEGRILAIVLMLIGIGTIGMVTGSIATYFIGSRGAKNPHIQHVQRHLDRWDELSVTERTQVTQILSALVREPVNDPQGTQDVTDRDDD